MIILELLVILLLTRTFGEASIRLGQPAAIGEILAGILLAGVAAALGAQIPLVPDLVNGEIFHHAATVGIFFLMLLAGIELKPQEIASHSLGSFMIALGGAIVPLGAGMAIGFFFLPPSENRLALSLLIGVAMAITAIPASVRILSDLSLMHSRVGHTIIVAALFDDVIGLVLLAILTALIKTGGAPALGEIAFILGKIGLFFAITVTLGVHVYPRLSQKLRTLQATALELSVLMAVALAYGLLAEILGMHWILGAFMAALFFEPGRVGMRAYDNIKLIVGSMTAGLFGPVFFASIGAQVDVLALISGPIFLTVVIFAAFAGKLIGAGMPALATGLPPRHALAVGVGMSSRGAVELIVLSIAVEAGLVVAGPESGTDTHHVYSSLVLMAIVTTLVTPSLLRAILGRESPENPEK
jgi:Kef-type K+ transport system membrane component KefB